MFKVGDKVVDTENGAGITETVKEVKQVWVVVTNEWPNLELPAERFELVKPSFPCDGTRVRDKHTGETGTIAPVGFNRGWYITLDEGARLDVPESYLLAHFEELVFPYAGAHWRRKATVGWLSNRGTVHSVEGDAVVVLWDGVSQSYPMTRAEFLENYEED